MVPEEFERREWPSRHYARFARYGAIQRLKTREPAPDEPRIATPVWALKQATEIGAGMAGNIAALGVRALGGLSPLGDLPQTDADPAPPTLPAEASGPGNRRRVPCRWRGRTEDRGGLQEIDARTMTRELTRRGWRLMRRRLHPHSSLDGQNTLR